MLSEILAYLHNYFADHANIMCGEFTVSGGQIALPNTIKRQQYIMISGSCFNDGVHQACADYLESETFTGYVVPLKIPAEVLKISAEIEEWQKKNGNATPYSSESFGGYSRSQATNKAGNPVSWQDVFAARLRRWRKL